MSVLGESTPQRSSSLELSSAPQSPPIQPSSTSHTSNPSTNLQNNETAKKSNTNSENTVKRRRKKDDIKDAITDGNSGDGKPKKPRAPRGTGARAMKKKAELAAAAAAAAAAATAAAGAITASTGNGVLSGTQKSTPQSSGSFDQPQASTLPPANHPFLSMHLNPSQTGNREAIHTSRPTHPQTSQHFTNQESRPSSGQNYDPIRSSTIARHLSPPTNTMSTPPRPTTASNATRSPSISSLIDPPDMVRATGSSQHASKRSNEETDHSSNESKRLRLTPPDVAATASVPKPYQPGRVNGNGTPSHQQSDSAVSSMTLPIIASMSKPDEASNAVSKTTTPGISKGPSPVPTPPKPVVRKEAPVLPVAGSGLLTGSIFGSAGTLDDPASAKIAPTVVINVSLAGKDHHTINFTRLAEEKYGFDALHPRLAAQRERLARVAAAGAALEKAQKVASGASLDDMSEDLSNDDGDNSNVEVNGIVGIKSGEDVDKPARKKRIMKEDMYDIDDEFIDDTEQAWEEQAAVSKDGFFVYSGPLVPEGQEAKVERNAENPPKRAARGGRGGRGGSSGRGGRSIISKDTKDEKEVKKRVRRSKEQIERDRKEAEEKKAQKERQTVLVSKPAAPFLPSQSMQVQFQASSVAH